MNKSLITFVFCILATTVHTFETSQVNGIEIKNQADLANYLKVLVGQNHDNMNEDLKKFVSDNKISIMNAADQVALIFQESENSQQTDLKASTFVKKLGEVTSKINVHDLTGKSSQEIKQYKQQNLNGEQKAHHIFGAKKELNKLRSLIKNQNRRLLQEVAHEGSDEDVSSTYITKFFFGLMFLLITLVLFFSIAYMDNKKDSLLYAKFIADVGR